MTRNLSQTEAIEKELESRLGKVVLKPWVKKGNHVASDIVPPDVLPDSRGAVVIPELTKSDLLNRGIRNGGRASLADPANEPDTTGSYPQFDPKMNEITVLVDPKELNNFELCIGMGLCVTWVQVARNALALPSAPPQPPPLFASPLPRHHS